VVGFGNTLRGGDGVGPEVAEMLAAELEGDGALVVSTQELLPELAEAVGRASLVVFIDAAMDRPAGSVATEPLEASPHLGEGSSPDVFSHGMRPADLLALARVLYRAAPEAVVVSVGAESFDVGWGLSDAVVRAVPRAARAVMAAIEAAQVEGTERA